MHAKMTRDRKKCFIATIEKTIEELEADIRRMKSVLSQVSTHSASPDAALTSAASVSSASMTAVSTTRPRRERQQATTMTAAVEVTPGATPVVQALPTPSNSLDENDDDDEKEATPVAKMRRAGMSHGFSLNC